MNCQEIEQVKSTKFLGLYIDDELTWKHHINHVVKKISRMTSIIAKAGHYLSLETLQAIYYTMVYPYLTYCNVSWTSTYPTRLKPLLMIQKKIVRIMSFTHYKDEFWPLFLSLNILNIYELNMYLMAFLCTHSLMIRSQVTLEIILYQMKTFIVTILNQPQTYSSI